MMKVSAPLCENKHASWQNYVSTLYSRTTVKSTWDMVRRISGKYNAVTCGRSTFSLDEGRIVPLSLPRHVVRGNYLDRVYVIKIVIPKLCI